MKTCTACYSKQTNYIDAMLYDGVPIADIARRTGLDRQVIGRHHRNGHASRRPTVETAQDGTVKGWQLQGFDSEEAWLQSLAKQFNVPLADLKAHIAAGHHLQNQPQQP